MNVLDGHVFLSHSSEDKSFVKSLDGDLTAAGYATWLDAHDLHGGAALPKHIAEAIMKAAAFVVVLSTNALKSRWLDYELQLAVTRMVEGQLLIIPAMLEDVARPPEVGALLYADFHRGTYEAGLDTILTGLAQRAEATAWPSSAIEDLLDEAFDGRGFTSLQGEYRSEDYEFVDIDMGSHGGSETMVLYEIVRTYSDEPRPLSERYLAEYLEAAENFPEPYSMLISERPIAFKLPAVDGTDERLLVREDRGVLNFFIDLSGTADPKDQQPLFRTLREMVEEHAAQRLRSHP